MQMLTIFLFYFDAIHKSCKPRVLMTSRIDLIVKIMHLISNKQHLSLFISLLTKNYKNLHQNKKLTSLWNRPIALCKNLKSKSHLSKFTTQRNKIFNFAILSKVSWWNQTKPIFYWNYNKLPKYFLVKSVGWIRKVGWNYKRTVPDMKLWLKFGLKDCYNSYISIHLGLYLANIIIYPTILIS